MPQEFRCSFFLEFLIQLLATKDVKDHYPKKCCRRNETNSRNEDAKNPTRKSVPPRSRNRSKSGRVREGQNSRIRRPSKSVYFSIQILFKIGRFWVRASPGLISRVFGGSKTGRPEGHQDRPPRRSTTRSKSTRSSRLSSVSLSLVLLRLVVFGSLSSRSSSCRRRR